MGKYSEVDRVREIIGPPFEDDDIVYDSLIWSDLRVYSIQQTAVRMLRRRAGRTKISKIERHRIIDIIIAEVQPLLPDQAGYAPAMARDAAERCVAKILYDAKE